MVPDDLEKYGIYLASSKSEKLRQTRGSQGFGAPSAFSDAQNTTGKPIFTVSKRFTSDIASVTNFYTTTANTKDHVGGPVDMDLPFHHGTFIKLHYLNIQYRRGYADIYNEMASLLNSHVTIIFIDPYGQVHIYPRRVNAFPEEPKYAQPHPASIRIGEFQDLLRETRETDLRGFLTKAFCRLSMNKARRIVSNASKDLRRRHLDDLKMTTPTDSLSKTEVELLYRSFSGEDYIAPPTDTVVPVGEEIFDNAADRAEEIYKDLPEAQQYDSDEVQFTVGLCWTLQEHHWPEPLFIGCKILGEILEIHPTKASKILRMLVADEVLEIVAEYIRGSKTRRYKFVGFEPEEPDEGKD